MECWSWSLATIFVCCWTIEEVMSVIEMVLGDKDDREVGRQGVRKAKSAETGICIRFSRRNNSSFGLNRFRT